MNKKLLVLVIVVSAALFVAAGIYAKAVPDIIKLEDPAYKEHKKGIALSYLLGYEVKEYFPGGYVVTNSENELEQIVEKPQRGDS